MEKKETKEKEIKYEVVKVPTNHELAIQTPEGDLINLELAIVEILNQIIELRKRLN